MKMTIELIRAAATQSEQLGKYLGLRDEPLSPEGRAALLQKVEEQVYPPVQLVFTGGLSRCLETARAIYPHQPIAILEELAPYDYGEFEGLTYKEIVADPRFESYAAANRMVKAPGGSEDPYAFLTRCGQAFRTVVNRVERKGVAQLAVITHQDVMRAVLQRFCVPRSLYRDWDADFGGGYHCSYDPETTALQVLGEI